MVLIHVQMIWICVRKDVRFGNELRHDESQFGSKWKCSDDNLKLSFVRSTKQGQTTRSLEVTQGRFRTSLLLYIYQGFAGRDVPGRNVDVLRRPGKYIEMTLLHWSWWQMFKTNCVGDIFEILVTVLVVFVTNIVYPPQHKRPTPTF